MFEYSLTQAPWSCCFCPRYNVSNKTHCTECGRMFYISNYRHGTSENGAEILMPCQYPLDYECGQNGDRVPSDSITLAGIFEETTELEFLETFQRLDAVSVDSAEGGRSGSNEGGSNEGRSNEIELILPEISVAPVDRTCLVCMTTPTDTMFLHGDTAHYSACYACSQRIVNSSRATCPVCRQPIEKLVRVY